jgi:hypothetical protein
MRRSTVLSLPLQLVFPGLLVHFQVGAALVFSLVGGAVSDRFGDNAIKLFMANAQDQ